MHAAHQGANTSTITRRSPAPACREGRAAEGGGQGVFRSQQQRQRARSGASRRGAATACAGAGAQRRGAASTHHRIHHLLHGVDVNHVGRALGLPPLGLGELEGGDAQRCAVPAAGSSGRAAVGLARRAAPGVTPAVEAPPIRGALNSGRRLSLKAHLELGAAVARRLCVALRGAGRLRCAEEVSWRLEGAAHATGVGRTPQIAVAAILVVR